MIVILLWYFFHIQAQKLGNFYPKNMGSISIFDHLGSTAQQKTRKLHSWIYKKYILCIAFSIISKTPWWRRVFLIFAGNEVQSISSRISWVFLLNWWSWKSLNTEAWAEWVDLFFWSQCDSQGIYPCDFTWYEGEEWWLNGIIKWCRQYIFIR